MTTRIEITETTKTDRGIVLLPHKTDLIEQKDVSPTGRMLVDSDRVAFIYILEDVNGFIYTSIGDDHWNALKTVLDNELDVFINWNSQQIELVNFREELSYLVSNIDGNANYGNEMVGQVTKTFINS